MDFDHVMIKQKKKKFTGIKILWDLYWTNKEIQRALNEISFVLFASVKLILNKTIWDKFFST